jgi:hypothetical protein
MQIKKPSESEQNEYEFFKLARFVFFARPDRLQKRFVRGFAQNAFSADFSYLALRLHPVFDGLANFKAS